MSFDLYFVPADTPFQESMAALEAAVSGDLSDEQLERWRDIAERCQAVMPDLVETVTSARAELLHPASGASLRMNGDELSAGSTHWYDDCCRGARVGDVLATYAGAVEEVCDLRPHDPQTGGWFSQFSVEWFDHSMFGAIRNYFSPPVDDMKLLRSTKGDEDRRKVANRLAADADRADMVHVIHGADMWLTELTLPEAPYEPKKDDLSLQAGQKMHKKNGFQIDVLRNVPRLVTALAAGDDKDLRTRLQAMKKPAFIDAKIAEFPAARNRPEYRELWEARQDEINDDVGDAVVQLRGDLVRLLEAAEGSKRKVITLTRWKDWFPPIQPPGSTNG